MSKIAWSGELMLLESRWTDRDGFTAKFKVVNPNEERPNPFKVFTRRRGGRAGTRFHAAFQEIEGVRTGGSAYDGQMMLAAWSDSPGQGYTVTFWCEGWAQNDDLARTHPFAEYTRNKDSFMCAFVELDDEEQPIDQQQRERVEHPKPKLTGVRPLSSYAAMLCQNEQFWEWIEAFHGEGPIASPEAAAVWMRAKLNIGSRRELDTDPEAARRYHSMIRIPFAYERAHDDHGAERPAELGDDDGGPEALPLDGDWDERDGPG